MAWTVSKAEQLELELRDLRTGQTVWSRSDPAESVISVLDTETLAVVTPQGELRLLAARTGKPLCPPISVNTDSVKGLVSWQDSERWYLALSKPVENLRVLKDPKLNASHRLKFINGTFYAIDRREPRILWQRELRNEAISLDQSRTAPVLVQLWKLAPKGMNDASDGMLRLIDKRTGKTLIEKRSVDILSYFLLNPDAQQAILELKLTQETIRLNFSSESRSKGAEVVPQSQTRPQPN